MIYPPAIRRQLLGTTDADYVWIIPFDRAFSQRTGQEFLELISERFHPLRSICVGPDFHFGHNRSGNVELLTQQSTLLQFDVPTIVPITEKNQEISSTEIRKCIRTGLLQQAAHLLGRPYEISGEIIPGQKLGRTIGFPTANLEVKGLVIPPNGVYPVKALLGANRLDGIMNIGVRPTMDAPTPKRCVEVHLFDFEEECYGKSLTVQPLQVIRPELRFSSLEALKEQIQIDCQEARKMLRSEAE